MNIKDTQSEEWLAVKGFCESKIAEMYVENEASLGVEATARLRGKIEFSKMVLDLANKSPVIEVKDSRYL